MQKIKHLKLDFVNISKKNKLVKIQSYSACDTIAHITVCICPLITTNA